MKLGSDVFYVTPLDAGVNAGAIRSARVVNINQATRTEGETVNLCVFKGHLRDGETADTECPLFFVYCAKHCPKHTPGTWHEETE